jgi:hypothetical protein
MKSFYILPYINVKANVLFDTENEANEFVEKAKNDPAYLKVNKQDTPFAGNFYVSVEYEECVNDKFLVTLADEDIVETVSCYLKNSWKNISLPDNWEIYEDIPVVKYMVECCECNSPFEMEEYEGLFEEFMYRNLISNPVEEFNFICSPCVNHLTLV